MSADLEAMAAALEASGDYRVLRRIVPRSVITEPDDGEKRLGLILDVETTGLDQAKDEIIEIAMLPFTYSPNGRIFEAHAGFSGLRQPSRPIPAEITALTGIDDEMVRGRSIDPGEVATFAASAVLVIAHCAEFDRPFAERLCPAFAAKHWACSMSEIDWAAEGVEGTKLGYLVQSFGLFYQRHRAMQDCGALLELLARPLPKSGVTGLSKLLEAARQPTLRIWAEGAPFASKDELKARGYRWNPGDDGRPKAWFFDAKPAAYDGEVAFLQKEIFRAERRLRVERLTARERFSMRSPA